MNACIKKLRSKKGASLILASAFFLLCAFVGGTVLAAATGGTAHLANRRSDEQAYLLQRSAARILQSELRKGVGTGHFQVAIEKTESGYSLEVSNPTSTPTSLQQLSVHGAMAVYGSEIASFTYTYYDYVRNEPAMTSGLYPSEGTLLLSMSEVEDGGTADSVTVDYLFDSNYDLTLTFLDENGHSLLHVYMKANVNRTEGGDRTTITWNDPVIRKGAGGA